MQGFKDVTHSMTSVVIHTIEEQTVYFYQTWVTRPGEARRKEILMLAQK